jgi:hypothetical protein
VSTEGLFDIDPAPVRAGDSVDVRMPWDETWRCSVLEVTTQRGWPAALLEHGTDEFLVDVARCRLVSSQPPLDSL